MTAPLVRVGDIAEQIRGVTFAKSDAVTQPAPGFVPVLRAGNIQEMGLDYQDLVYVPADRVRDKQRVKRNDILIAASSGSLEAVGKAARSLTDFEGGFGAFCKVLRPRSDVDPSYFAHYFKTSAYRREVSSLAEGANINNLKTAHLDELLIPLPPLCEQRRIAAILDHADALRSRRRQALAHLEDLTQSIYLNMFGDPMANPSGYQTAELGEVTSKIGSGATPRGGSSSYTTAGIALIRSMNVRDEGFTDRNLAFINDDQARLLSGVVVERDDVLLNITGASVARVSRAPAQVLPARVNQHVAILRPDPSRLLPQVLERQLLAPSYKAHLLHLAGGGATREAITKAQIAQLKVLLPPIDTQQEFTRRVEQLRHIQQLGRTSLMEYGLLFSSLQFQAFSGKL